MWPRITRSSIRCCPNCGRAGRVGSEASPSIPIITTVDSTGPTPAFDADYWAANLRNPVRFSQAIATAGRQHATFIEISPHPLLTHAIKDTLGGHSSPQHRTLQRDIHETLTFHTNLNATHTTAPPGRRTHLNPTRSSPPPPGTTPTTGSAPPAHARAGGGYGRPGRGRPRSFGASTAGEHVRLPEEPERHAWQGEVGTRHSMAADHQIHAVPAFPGAAYCEMALAAARTTLGDASEVRDIRFEQMLLLDEQTLVTAVASMDAPGIATFAVQTDDAGETSPARRRGPACGRGWGSSRRAATRPPARRAPGPVVASELRLSLARGVSSWSGFHRSGRAHTGGGRRTVLAEIGLPARFRAPAVRLRHPPRSAGCLLPIRGRIPAGRRRPAQCRSGGLLLPLSIGRLRRFGAGRDARYCHVTVTRADPTAIDADLEVLDEKR